MNVAWYLSRSAGLVAYLLLFATVALGISIRTRGLDRVIARWRVTDLHLFLSLLTIGLVIIHAVALLWDSFVGYSLLNILMPFSTGYRTVWTTVGIATLYLLVIVAISFPARRFIGYRAWRSLHYATFAAYAGALVHGIYTGTDSQVAWAQAIYFFTAGILVLLGLYRVALWSRGKHGMVDKAESAAPTHRRTAAERAAIASHQAIENRTMQIGAGAVTALVFVFIAAGLGPFHWLGGSSNTAASDVPLDVQTTSGRLSNDFKEGFTGSISQSRSGSATNLRIVANATGARPATLIIALTLVPDARGSNQATANSLVLSAPGGATLCTGQVQRMDDQSLLGECVGAGQFQGQQFAVDAEFDSGLTAQISGTLLLSAES